MGLAVVRLLFAIISLNTIRCEFCIKPSHEYKSKTALVTKSFLSGNAAIKAHIGSCGEYCFNHAFGDVAHFLISTSTCYCFNVSTEIVYSYKYEDNLISINDVVLPVHDLGKLIYDSAVFIIVSTFSAEISQQTPDFVKLFTFLGFASSYYEKNTL